MEGRQLLALGTFVNAYVHVYRHPCNVHIGRGQYGSSVFYQYFCLFQYTILVLGIRFFAFIAWLHYLLLNEYSEFWIRMVFIQFY